MASEEQLIDALYFEYAFEYLNFPFHWNWSLRRGERIHSRQLRANPAGFGLFSEEHRVYAGYRLIGEGSYLPFALVDDRADEHIAAIRSRIIGPNHYDFTETATQIPYSVVEWARIHEALALDGGVLMEHVEAVVEEMHGYSDDTVPAYVEHDGTVYGSEFYFDDVALTVYEIPNYPKNIGLRSFDTEDSREIYQAAAGELVDVPAVIHSYAKQHLHSRDYIPVLAGLFADLGNSVFVKPGPLVLR